MSSIIPHVSSHIKPYLHIRSIVHVSFILNSPLLLAMSFKSIPVLDLSQAQDVGTKPAFLEDLRYALMEVGFFYISNTGIEDDLVQDVITQGRLFFDLPDEKKLEIQMKNAASFLGINAPIKLIPQDDADFQATTNSAMKSRGIRLIGVSKSTSQLRIRFHRPALPSTTTSSPPTNGQTQLLFPLSGLYIKRISARCLSSPHHSPASSPRRSICQQPPLTDSSTPTSSTSSRLSNTPISQSWAWRKALNRKESDRTRTACSRPISCKHRTTAVFRHRIWQASGSTALQSQERLWLR